MELRTKRHSCCRPGRKLLRPKGGINLKPIKAYNKPPTPINCTKKTRIAIVGEVFSRGYVNGLIEAGQHLKTEIVYSTVGRRTKEGELVPLSDQELAMASGAPLINIPLECGFDLTPNSGGVRPVDLIKDWGLNDWQTGRLDFAVLEECRRLGREDFRRRLGAYVEELKTQLQPNEDLVLVHTMAGGVPRAKVVMPAMNRIFKGHGPRYSSSEEFWASDLGRFCEASFMDVTANSFSDLIELSAPLRESVEKSGGQVSYLAYGYHGTEILIHGEYQWQSYSPYLQGFAKLKLEEIAKQAQHQSVCATVFNCPEILTNSSSIFLGVEVALYPLLWAFEKEGGKAPLTQSLFLQARQKLVDEKGGLEKIHHLTNSYFASDVIRQWTQFQAWPQHNGPQQMELMRATSQQILDWHRTEKDLLTAVLSELVFRGCGRIALRETLAKTTDPVWWIGHDAVAKEMLATV